MRIQEYSYHKVAPEYPWVTNPRIRNIVLPWDMGYKVEFNMLPFIMFNSMPGSGHGKIFKPCKRYRVPRARTKKKEVKKENFDL